MLIDWFTVIAQALNFLLLVWLLKRFLYKPVLKAIQERENRIKKQIEDAEHQLAEAEKAKKDFRQKNEAFEQQRESLLQDATEEAGKTRRKLLADARKEVKNLRARLEAAVREEQKNLSREIVHRTRDEVLSISRQVLSDLADRPLEEQIVHRFLQKLKGLKGADQKAFQKALQPPSRQVTIRSAFEVPAKDRKEIEASVRQLNGKLQFQYETAPQLIGGIELSGGGYKVSWSIEDYLRNLKRNIEELLGQEEEAPAPPVKTAPNESKSR